MTPCWPRSWRSESSRAAAGVSCAGSNARPLATTLSAPVAPGIPYARQPCAYLNEQYWVHTNGMENFWSLLKRGSGGTYVSVEPFHLVRYLDEQTFRYNTRKGNDGDRFRRALSQIAGRRLTYKHLTGKDESAVPPPALN